MDFSNKRFGKLTARWPVGRKQHRRIVWLCSCDCGELRLIRFDNLLRAGANSCGCAQITHGQCKNFIHTIEYTTFRSAMNRCTNKNCKDWKNYGGRGIRFKFKSFQEFFSCLGKKPRGLTLERLNNNGHYEPGNVCWATRKEQRANRRR